MSGTGNYGRSPRAKVLKEERRDKVMGLARAGASHRQIAKMLEGTEYACSSRTVERDVAHRLRVAGETCGDAKAVRLMYIGRLEELHRTFYPLAKAGDYMALDRVLKIEKDLAGLHGVAPVTKVEVRGDAANPITVDVQHRPGLDLDKLDVDELRTLERLMTKARPGESGEAEAREPIAVQPSAPPQLTLVEH
ncbi:MAG: hypothetical protein OXE76_04030 [Alphaproteobacteria bacterium]|nr:hypothetical protein [Alphaproteobacteria bacterium]